MPANVWIDVVKAAMCLIVWIDICLFVCLFSATCAKPSLGKGQVFTQSSSDKPSYTVGEKITVRCTKGERFIVRKTSQDGTKTADTKIVRKVDRVCKKNGQFSRQNLKCRKLGKSAFVIYCNFAPSFPKIPLCFSLLKWSVSILALNFAMSSHFPLPEPPTFFVPSLSFSNGVTCDRRAEDKRSDVCLPRPYYPGQKKKRTVSEIRGEKNIVRYCGIVLDHERSVQGKVIRDVCPVLIARDRTWYYVKEQHSSHHKSQEWFFFLAG